MGKREVYLTGVKSRITLWTAQLEDLKNKAVDRVDATYHKQLDAWKAGANAISDKLTEMRGLDEKWYAIKAEIEKGLRTIESALGKVEPPKTEAGESPEPPAAKPKPRPTA